MTPRRIVLMLIALSVAAFAAACSPAICHCPFEGTSPGWCDPVAAPGGGCFCPKSVICTGFCIPDGGGDPVHCDGG